MAVEKMVMMNIVGEKKHFNNIIKDIILMGKIHLVNAINEIKESNFTISVLDENIDELVEITTIKECASDDAYIEAEQKIEDIIEILGLESRLDKEALYDAYDFNSTLSLIDKLYENIYESNKKYVELKEEYKYLSSYEKNFTLIKNWDVTIEDLNNLEYFEYEIGSLDKENAKKLEHNYEKISAVVQKVASDEKREIYIVISPTELKTETDRILESLNFNKIEMSSEFVGSPSDILKQIEEKKRNIDVVIETLRKDIDKAKEIYEVDVINCYSKIQMQKKIEEVKFKLASTKNFFYLAGWLPEEEKINAMEELSKYRKELHVMFKEEDEVYKYFTPPTKLKNNFIFKPFEALVSMYGTPSYNEMDPTSFLGFTYLLLFGAMFGDIGQGLVFILLGMYLKYKKNIGDIASILIRVGFSSSIFGALYGSIFGVEGLIHPLLINPIENINVMLASSVIVGVFLIVMSFVYSILNAIKEKNIEEGIFGRNGFVGFVFYSSLILFVLTKANMVNLPANIVMLALIISVVLMFFKEPITSILTGRRPIYKHGASEYYVEGGFDLFETILSTLSGTISFIRVGAFALNHVGLFIAFHTMGELLGTFAGSVIVMIIGNIIVIGLEGLIVSIQSLRLEYYEMFSRYYKGEGIKFETLKI